MYVDRLIELRKKSHLTQENLAQETGLSKSLIEKLEKGNRPGSLKSLNILADFFNVSVDYLLGKDDATMQRKTNVVNSLLNKLVDAGIITDSEHIDNDTQEMILYAVRVEIDKILKKEKE